MRAKRRQLAFAAILAAPVLPAAACGFCVEDRVAGVYDQAMIDGALTKGRNVVFLALDGLKADAAARRSVIVALEAGGAVRGSSRIATQRDACSVVYDPARTNLATLVGIAERALAPRGIALSPVRVIGKTGVRDDFSAAEERGSPRSPLR